MNEECACPCHNSSLMVMHIAPCCEQCNYCGKHIRFECLEEHVARCGGHVGQWQQQVARQLADIEDVLVSALSFYADPENWQGQEAKAVADSGEIARRALAQVEYGG